MHPDGSIEDSWGRQTIERVAKRFDLLEYEITEREHIEILKTIKDKSAQKFAQAYQEAEEVIKKYRRTT